MRLTWLTLICSLFITLSVSELRSQTVDDGVIRFEEPSESEVELQPNFQDTPGFDQHAFESRMESLWFQRKAYLTEGLEEDAARASASLLIFCREEGLARVTDLSGALLIEAEQFRQNGRHRWALNSIALAEDLDPGRSQTAFLKAKILWGSGAGIVKTIGTWSQPHLPDPLVRGSVGCDGICGPYGLASSSSNPP